MSRLFVASVGLGVSLVWGCGSSSGNDLFGSTGGGRPGAGGAVPDPGLGSVAGGASSGGSTSDRGGATPAGGGARSAGGSGGLALQAGGATSAAGGTSSGGGSADSGPPSCAPGTLEVCPCVEGTGARTCKDGMFGPCMCGACLEGHQSACSCPDGATMGVANCAEGRLGGCLGCPVGPSGCPVGMTCSSTGAGPGGNTPMCAGKNGLPPGCQLAADCATLGVTCTVLPILGGLCLKGCKP